MVYSLKKKLSKTADSADEVDITDYIIVNCLPTILTENTAGREAKNILLSCILLQNALLIQWIKVTSLLMTYILHFQIYHQN